MFFVSPIFFLYIDYSSHDPFRFVFGCGHTTTLYSVSTHLYPSSTWHFPYISQVSTAYRLYLAAITSYHCSPCYRIAWRFSFCFQPLPQVLLLLRQLVALTKTFHTNTVFLTLTWGHVRLPGLHTCLCATSYILTYICASLGRSVTQSVHSSYLFNLHYY